MYNLNFKFPILFIFFASILITSTIFVNRPAQSQQQISQLDDIISEYNEKIYGDGTNPPPPSYQGGQTGSQLDDIISEYNEKIYGDGRNLPQGGLQQQQPYTSTNPSPSNLNPQIKLVDNTPTSFETLITFEDSSTINFKFEFTPNLKYQPTQLDLDNAKLINNNLYGINAREEILNTGLQYTLHYFQPYDSMDQKMLTLLNSLGSSNPNTSFSPSKGFASNIIKPVQFSQLKEGVGIKLDINWKSASPLDYLTDRYDKIDFLGDILTPLGYGISWYNVVKDIWKLEECMYNSGLDESQIKQIRDSLFNIKISIAAAMITKGVFSAAMIFAQPIAQGGKIAASQAVPFIIASGLEMVNGNLIDNIVKSKIKQAQTLIGNCEEKVNVPTQQIPKQQVPKQQVPSTLCRITIEPGASNPDFKKSYDPNYVSGCDKVTWINRDITIHAAVSGYPNDPNAGKIFDTAIIAPGQETSANIPPGTASEYFCNMHPWMTGELSN